MADLKTKKALEYFLKEFELEKNLLIEHKVEYLPITLDYSFEFLIYGDSFTPNSLLIGYINLVIFPKNGKVKIRGRKSLIL